MVVQNAVRRSHAEEESGGLTRTLRRPARNHASRSIEVPAAKRPCGRPPKAVAVKPLALGLEITEERQCRGAHWQKPVQKLKTSKAFATKAPRASHRKHSKSVPLGSASDVASEAPKHRRLSRKMSRGRSRSSSRSHRGGRERKHRRRARSVSSSSVKTSLRSKRGMKHRRAHNHVFSGHGGRRVRSSKASSRGSSTRHGDGNALRIKYAVLQATAWHSSAHCHIKKDATLVEVIQTAEDIWKSKEVILVLHAGLGDIQNNDASHDFTDKLKSQIPSSTATAIGHFCVFYGVSKLEPKVNAMRTKFKTWNKNLRTPTRQPVVSFSTEEIRRDPLPSSRNPILNAGAPIMQPVFGIPVEEIRQGTHPSSRDPMFNAGAPIMQPVFGIPVEEIRQGTHPSSRDPMFNAGAPIMQPVFGIPVEEIRQGTHPSSRDLMFNSGVPIMQPAFGFPVEEIRRGTHPSSRDLTFTAGTLIMQPAFGFSTEEIRRDNHPSFRNPILNTEVTVIAENQPRRSLPNSRSHRGVPFSAAAAPCCDECLSLQLLSCGVAQPLRTVALPSTVTSLPTQPVQVLPNTLPTSSHFAMNDGRSAWVRCHTCDADFTIEKFSVDHPCLVGQCQRDVAYCSVNSNFCKVGRAFDSEIKSIGPRACLSQAAQTAVVGFSSLPFCNR
ncbi:hypothetical protein MRX96_000513 [Rhipicephalus microplus]